MKSMKVGIEKTWNFEERLISSSTFTFPKVIWSPYFVASLSITGSITMQGPHHVAQKSTSRGFEAVLYAWTFSSVSFTSPSVGFDASAVIFCIFACKILSRSGSKRLSRFGDGYLKLKADRVVVMYPEDALLRLVKRRLTPGQPSELRGEKVASVAVAFRYDASLKTLMIRRADREGDVWSGQVAFPGGRRGKQDRSLLETAIREAREEVGIDLARSALYLGHLGTFKTHTGAMLVVPCAFLIRDEVVRVRPNVEVASYRWVPVEFFLEARSRSTEILKRGRDTVKFPAYVYQDYVIWGLTYKIISTLIAGPGGGAAAATLPTSR